MAAASPKCCFAFRQGIRLPVISKPFQRNDTMYRPYSSGDTVRAAPIRVVRVVVVDVPAAINIPRVVRVASIGRPQAHVHSGRGAV